MDVISEMGEVSKELLKGTNYGEKKPNKNDKIKVELGDLLFSVIELANTLEVNLDEALNKVLKKYQKRIKKGGIGSEHDK